MSTDPEKLEQLVNDLVREQPLRRAPASLQNRVLAQLNSRVPSPARHWWSRGFTHWPLAARVGFLVSSVGFVWLALLAVTSVSRVVGPHDVVGAVGPAATWVHAIAVVVNAISSLSEWIVSTVPPEWLYGAAALAVVLYAVLFGLGTVAYRALYVNK